MAVKCAKAMRFMYSHSLFMIVIKFFLYILQTQSLQKIKMYICLYLLLQASKLCEKKIFLTGFLLLVIFFYFYFYDIIYFVISPEAVNGEDNYTEINIKFFMSYMALPLDSNQRLWNYVHFLSSCLLSPRIFGTMMRHPQS